MVNYSILEEVDNKPGGSIGTVANYPDIDAFTLRDAVDALEEIGEPDADELYHGGAIAKIRNGIAVGFIEDTNGNAQPFQIVYRFRKI